MAGENELTDGMVQEIVAEVPVPLQTLLDDVGAEKMGNWAKVGVLL